MPQTARWFVAARSRALARMYLTRRGDLVVTEPEADVGLDYVVHIVKGGDGEGVRQFGLALGGAVEPVTEGTLNTMLKPLVQRLARAGPFPYPVCLFYFTMEDNGAYYAWIAEPLVAEDGTPQLQVQATATAARLVAESVDAIVARVDRWYDAFTATVVTRPREANRNDGLRVLHGIIDAQAEYVTKHGKPPRLLKLPLPLAYDLAKLGRDHLGELSGEVIRDGVGAFEEHPLLGMKVKLVRNGAKGFSFE
jgi:hypothetical protein